MLLVGVSISYLEGARILVHSATRTSSVIGYLLEKRQVIQHQEGDHAARVLGTYTLQDTHCLWTHQEMLHSFHKKSAGQVIYAESYAGIRSDRAQAIWQRPQSWLRQAR
jgi:hypothetical protein